MDLLDHGCLVETAKVDGLWFRRTRTLGLSYDIMRSGGLKGVDFSKFDLRKDLVSQIVDHYCNDYQILRLRYHIAQPQYIQLHRVAGLLTSAIMRYRPIHCISGQPVSKNEVRLNEHFAVFTGINICAEKYAQRGEDISELLSSCPQLAGWIDRMKFLLDSRNYTSEALIMAYDALCVFLFPDNFDK
jgi:hypothetical protein